MNRKPEHRRRDVTGGMVLPKDQIAPIRRGQRCWLLRRVKPEGNPPFLQGHVYAVQSFEMRTHPDSGNRYPHVSEERCRVLVTELHRRSLDSITETEAELAGYESLEHLYDFWRVQYGDGPMNPDCETWVIRFELDHHQRPLFLRSGGGYTHSVSEAMPEEPECVDERTLARFAKDNRLRWEDGRKSYLAERALDAEIARLRALKGRLRAGDDIGRELDEIRRRGFENGSEEAA